MLNRYLNPYLLLILSVVSIIASIVDDRSTVEGFVVVLLSAIMILIGLREARFHHRLFSTRVFVLFLVLIFISILCDVLYDRITGSLGLKSLLFVIAALIRLGIFGYGWWSLVKTLATRQKITDRTIVTAITGYLFIGIIYSFIYLTIWQLDPKAFHISAVRDYDFKPWNLVMYFSFMTLTTVGYGDVIPINKWLMALANFEAMIGAIYLTVIIARLVSLYSTSD